MAILDRYTEVGTGVYVELSAGDIDGPGDSLLGRVFVTEEQVRQLHHWFDKALRLEHSLVALNLRNVVTKAYNAQAVRQGRADAFKHGESQLSPHADPLWRDGYEHGFAVAMSEIADTNDERST